MKESFPMIPHARNAVLIAAFAASIGSIRPALAHDWFIQAVDYQLQGPGTTVLFQGWGHKLPLDDAIAGDKMARLRLMSPDGDCSELSPAEGRSFHAIPVELKAPGIHTVLGESTPGFYNIYADKDGKMHHSTRALDELTDAARVVFSVRAFQFPKTYVVVGELPQDAESPGPAGAKVEIVPHQAPGTLQAGDRLSFSILFDGKPAPDGTEFDATYMGFSTAAEDYLYMGRTTAGGEGSIDLCHPGVWYIRTHLILPATSDMAKKCRNMLYDATLSLHVLERMTRGVDSRG
jgi:hypothetical protein